MLFPSGRALLDAEKILKEVGLAEGQGYVDFGCGALGHFVFPAALIVGRTGRVWAVDVLKTALAAVAARASERKIFNLQTVWGDLENNKGTEEIPNGAADLVSLVNLSGLLLKTPAAMRNIKRVLKNNGRLLIIDWRPDSFLRRFFSEHETAANRLVPHLKQNGFRLLRSFSIGRHHFGLLLENYA